MGGFFWNMKSDFLFWGELIEAKKIDFYMSCKVQWTITKTLHTNTRYPPLKEVELNSLPLVYGLYLMTCFQKAESRKGENSDFIV